MKLSFYLSLWRTSRPFRFLIVGVWNFIFGYLCFAVCYRMWNTLLPDGVIVCIASVIGITNAFFFHRHLTYRSHGNAWGEYLKFYLVYGVQTALNMALIALFVTRWKYNAYLCQLLISIALIVVSYWGHNLFSFRKKC